MMLSFLTDHLAVPHGVKPNWSAARAKVQQLTEVEALDVAAGSELLSYSLADLRAGLLEALRARLNTAIDRLELVWSGETGIYPGQHLRRSSYDDVDEIGMSVAAMNLTEEAADIRLLRTFGLADAAGFLPERTRHGDEGDAAA